MKYRHFKGGIYFIICVAECTETGQRNVIYTEYSENGIVDYNKIWSREITNFLDSDERATDNRGWRFCEL